MLNHAFGARRVMRPVAQDAFERRACGREGCRLIRRQQTVPSEQVRQRDAAKAAAETPEEIAARQKGR